MRRQPPPPRAPILRLWETARLATGADQVRPSAQGRYARQMQISGWEQSRLAQATVAIIGSGLLAGSVAWGLAALGVGRIFLLDDRCVEAAGAAFPWLDATVGQTAVSALAKSLMTINPKVTAVGLGSRLLYDAHAAAIPDCDVLVDAGHDFPSKLIAWESANAQHRPLIAAATGRSSGLYQTLHPWQSHLPDDFLAYHGQPQGIVPALVIGGLVLEEVRQLLLPLAQDKPIVTAISFDMDRPERFHLPVTAGNVWPVLRPRHALLVGAGALGNFVGLGLALAGTRELTIVDPDRIEETNLNRQVLFYDAVGQPKATMLATRLRRLTPRLKTTAVTAPVTEAHLQDVDAIFACVDNFATRAELNRLSAQTGIPLINGGSGPFNGEVQVYEPGHTACLNCALDVEQLAAMEAGERAGCGRTPAASVVIANQIIAGLMVAEACRLGNPCTGTLVFNAAEPGRVGIRTRRPACSCHLEKGA